MKNTLTHFLKPILQDRPVLLLMLLIAFVGVAYVIYAALSLSPTELQIATKYTAFGDTQYYRNKWYYLLTFIGLAVVIVSTHTGLMAKLHAREMRSMAVAVGWLSVLLLAILFVITRSVLGIAYLS